MDPVAATPTEPVDYAKLSSLYAVGVLGVILLGRRSNVRLRDRDIVPLGIASFSLAKLLTKEKVETWLREPFVEELPDGAREPKGDRLRYAVGELLTCSRCMGAWSALALTALRVARPREAHVIIALVGANAVNDFLQAGFARMCAAATRE